MSDKCRVAFELCKKRSEHLFDAEVQRCSKCYEKEDDYDACVSNGDDIRADIAIDCYKSYQRCLSRGDGDFY